MASKKSHPPCSHSKIADEPCLTLPAPSNLPQLGQKSVISESFQMGQFSNLAYFKARGHAIRYVCVREGRGSCRSEQ